MFLYKAIEMIVIGMTTNALAKILPFRPPKAAHGRLASSAIPAPITQERLRRGVKLREEELRIAQASHEFLMELERDLAAGASIEQGCLTFDRSIRIVRRQPETAAPAREEVIVRPGVAALCVEIVRH